MAYKINYHGFDVTCETVADLRALVGQNGNGQLKSTTQTQTSFAPVEKHGEPSGIGGLVGKLPKELRNLLRFVAQAHGTIPRDRLREMVGVSDTHKFAGMLISISKFADGAGVESPLERVTVRENGSGPRVYHYKIQDDVKAEVKEALAIQ